MDENLQTPQQPVEPQEQAPVVAEKKSGKSWILIAILVLVAAYAGVAYWKDMWPF